MKAPTTVNPYDASPKPDAGPARWKRWSLPVAIGVALITSPFVYYVYWISISVALWGFVYGDDGDLPETTIIVLAATATLVCAVGIGVLRQRPLRAIFWLGAFFASPALIVLALSAWFMIEEAVVAPLRKQPRAAPNWDAAPRSGPGDAADPAPRSPRGVPPAPTE